MQTRFVKLEAVDGGDAVLLPAFPDMKAPSAKKTVGDDDADNQPKRRSLFGVPGDGWLSGAGRTGRALAS